MESRKTIIWGSRDGAVVRTLASHQCGQGSIPGLGIICGLTLLLVLVLAPGEVFLRVLSPVFPSPQKPTFPLAREIPQTLRLLLTVIEFFIYFCFIISICLKLKSHSSWHPAPSPPPPPPLTPSSIPRFPTIPWNLKSFLLGGWVNDIIITMVSLRNFLLPHKCTTDQSAFETSSCKTRRQTRKRCKQGQVMICFSSHGLRMWRKFSQKVE